MRRLLSFHAVLILSLALITAIPLRLNWSGGFTQEYESDLWWHAVVGNEILDTWNWPTADTYSFTVKGHRWIAYEWLPEVSIALAERVGGLLGWTILRLVLATAFLVLLFEYCRIKTGNMQASFLATFLGSLFLVGSFFLRPQLPGFLFLLIFLILLELFRQRALRSLWSLPLLMILWVNTHGSFTIGLIVLSWFWLTASLLEAAQRRHVATVLLLCFAVLPLTPYGSQIAAYPMELLLYQNFSTSVFREWQPFSLDSVEGIWTALLAILCLVSFAVNRASLKLFDLGLVVAGIAGAMRYRRLTIVLAVFAIPVIASTLSRWVRDYRAEAKPILNGLLILTFGLSCILLLPSARQRHETLAASYPVTAVKFLHSQNFRGRIFNESGGGGYLVWEGIPVFIDGRGDLYDYSGVLKDYLTIINLTTPELLQSYQIDACDLPGDFRTS